MTSVVAHGIGGVTDLPVPSWLFFYGGAAVLVLSFALLGALWREPRLETAPPGRPLPEPLQRILLSRGLRVAVGAVSAFLLGLVIVASLFGARSSGTNIAPTLVWVLFWLGLVPVVVLLGNVWRVLNPWAAVADAAVWLVGRRTSYAPIAYPERLGRWPAAVLLFAFTGFELAYPTPSDPRALGVAVVVYSVVTWYGMLTYGRRAWLEHGEAFTVYFGLLARLAPFGTRETDRGREIVVRRPLAGLAARDAVPGTVAFVAVMLGSVSFDGLSRTSAWQDAIYRAATSGAGSWGVGLLNLAGVAAMVGAVALTYAAASGVAARLAGTDDRLERVFVWSLVPIALAYAVAHYFSLLVLQGQYAIRMASDPLGRGWDLFGTAGYRATFSALDPNLIWYVQVGALVIGHVIGLVLAHDRALARFRPPRVALRTQYSMLALMVLYTVGGLWLLSQG